MNTQVEHQDNHTVRLTVEVEQPRVEKAMQDAAKRISREVNIPGFRKGKAPYSIILQRFGPKVVLDEAIEHLGQDVYKEALNETKLEPYAMATLDNIETEPTLKLIFTVPKKPEITLGNYRELRAPYEAPQVEDKAVDSAIEAMQERRAVTEIVTRPAALGDLVKAKVSADATYAASEEVETEAAEKAEASEKPAEEAKDQPAVAENTEPAEAKTEPETPVELKETATITEEVIEEQELSVVMTEDQERDVFPGFSAHLVGLNAGESTNFDLEIAADYKDEEVAGKTLHCKVEVLEVQSRTLPVLNDEFAKQSSDSKFETLLELRVDSRKQLQEAAEQQAEKTYSDKLFDQIVTDATIKYPDAMVEEYIDDLVKEMDEYLRENNLTMARYKQIGNKTDADIRDMNRERAVARIKSSLVFSELVNAEHIHVHNEEVEKRIDELSAQFGEQAAAFRTMFQRPETMNRIAMDIVSKKLSDRVLEIGQGKAPSLESLEHEHDHEHEDENAHEHAAAPEAPKAESAANNDAVS